MPDRELRFDRRGLPNPVFDVGDLDLVKNGSRIFLDVCLETLIIQSVVEARSCGPLHPPPTLVDGID
jgi:hypothetical protein